MNEISIEIMTKNKNIKGFLINHKNQENKIVKTLKKKNKVENLQ